MRMPEPGPFGETLFDAKTRAMVDGLHRGQALMGHRALMYFGIEGGRGRKLQVNNATAPFEGIVRRRKSGAEEVSITGGRVRLNGFGFHPLRTLVR